MSPPRNVYTLNGQQCHVQDLAQAAGCTLFAMRARLRTMTPEQAVAKGANDTSRLPLLYPYRDQRLTVRQLADLAGCRRKTMKERLLYRSPEQAVAMGKEATHRGCKHEYQGQQLTSLQLARLAGCKHPTMRNRLRRGTPVEMAVAMGPESKAKRNVKPRAEKPAKPPKQRKPRVDIVLSKPASKPARAYDKLPESAPVICNVQPVVIPHSEDHRHTFTGTPGRWVNSAECRPWAAAVRG